MSEHPIEEQESDARHNDTRDGGDRRANPDRRSHFGQNNAARAERGDKTRQNSGTEERDPRNAAVIVARFGMAAGAEIPAVIVAAEELAGNRANNREQQTQSQASNVDNHNASLAHFWLIKSVQH